MARGPPKEKTSLCDCLAFAPDTSAADAVVLFAGEIVAVDATPEMSTLDWLVRIGHEWIGHIAARTVERDC